MPACILECLAFADARGKKLMKFRNRWTLHVLDHVKGKVLRASTALVPSRINSSFRAAVIGIGVKLHERLVNAYPSLQFLRARGVECIVLFSHSLASATLRKELNSLCELETDL